MSLPVAILGGGPVALEAALALAESDRPFVLFESGGRVGSHVRDWGHVRLFTPWSMNVSPRARAALEDAGVDVPGGDDCPTGYELASSLLDPIAALPTVAPNVRTGTRVVAVTRDGVLKNHEIGTGARADVPFRILVRDDAGQERVELASAVLDCTGTWGHPNALGSGGIPAPGEGPAAHRITRSIPDFDDEAVRSEWAGARILLVGAGHSAQTAAVALAALAREQPDTKMTWVIRSSDPDFSADPSDPLPARRALHEEARALADGGNSPFDVRRGRSIEGIEETDDGLRVHLAEGESIEVDQVLSLTGSVGDASLYRQLQVHECYATSGPMNLAAALLSSSSADCLDQVSHGADTLRNPEPDFYILGSKSYGRNNTFLLRVGWEQVDDVLSLLPEPAIAESI